MTSDVAPDPIVVYGAPRSGTTYLQAILNAHPDFFISNERRVFAWLHHALSLTHDHRLVANHPEAFIQYLRTSLPQLLRAFYRGVAPDARYWGDKNPHYADPFNRGCLDAIADLFPRSRFIHIIRDGRDVVASLVQKRWTEERPWVTFKQAHRTWKTHVRLGRAIAETVSSDRYFELRYEALVLDDLAVARDLFAFLGLDLHPAVEAFCHQQQEKRTPFSDPTRDLAAPIATSQWSQLFTLEEQARSLDLMGPSLILYGYETDASLAELRATITDAIAAAGAAAARPRRD